MSYALKIYPYFLKSNPYSYRSNLGLNEQPFAPCIFEKSTLISNDLNRSKFKLWLFSGS